MRAADTALVRDREGPALQFLQRAFARARFFREIIHRRDVGVLQLRDVPDCAAAFRNPIADRLAQRRQRLLRDLAPFRKIDRFGWTGLAGTLALPSARLRG